MYLCNHFPIDCYYKYIPLYFSFHCQRLYFFLKYLICNSKLSSRKILLLYITTSNSLSVPISLELLNTEYYYFNHSDLSENGISISIYFSKKNSSTSEYFFMRILAIFIFCCLCPLFIFLLEMLLVFCLFVCINYLHIEHINPY